MINCKLFISLNLRLIGLIFEILILIEGVAMNTSTRILIAIIVAVVSLTGCGTYTGVYKPGNKDEPVMAKTLSLGGYDLQGSEDDRPAADEVAKKFIAKFAEDLSEKGVRVLEKDGELVVTFAIRYGWKIGITAVIPLPTVRYELTVIATVKRGSETVLVVSGHQSGGIIFTTSFFVNSVSKQIAEKFGEKIKLT